MEISLIVIPALQTEAGSIRRVDPIDLTTYQNLVGGHLEAVRLDDPPASMYINDEGKLLGLPVNIRATQLAWAHNEGLRGHDLLAGPAFVTGPVDREGLDTAVPQAYLDQLLPSGPWRVEVLAYGETRWATNAVEYVTREAAYAAARNLRHRWIMADKLRVVPTSTPRSQAYEEFSEHLGWSWPG